MKRIALKIDVDTFHGTRTGVPALIALLQRLGAQATFFFSLGPDQSGQETRKESLGRYYDLNTRLYGRLLPGPEIAARCVEILLQTSRAGFETGIHAWNRARWEQLILASGNKLAEAEMGKACERFSKIFGVSAKSHAAAGWRMNRHALRLTQRLGFAYASDCRGNHPFLPVIDGELVDCVQIPTTLPTLDEVLALEPGLTADQAADRLVQLSSAIPGDHVFTLRAELEGMKFITAFERMLKSWKDLNYPLVALREIRAELDLVNLPRHSISFSEIAGRPGTRMIQGSTFP